MHHRFDRLVAQPLQALVDATAASLLALNLAVVAWSVLSRTLLAEPLEWADDVARGLLVAASFFGAASALARGDSVGVMFFADRLSLPLRRLAIAGVSLLVTGIAAAVAIDAFTMGALTTGQTTGSGLPLQWSFYPMGAGAACMTVFALARVLRHGWRDIIFAAGLIAALAGLAWLTGPGTGTLLALGFLLALIGGMPIGFALAFAALIFIWADGTLPGAVFAQQMARGIDNFVLLAIPFFILTGIVMEANGMSVRLIALIERLAGRLRGGLNIVMVLSMVVFSGISGSKMADVAAVGVVLVPAARRAGQPPGEAVALLAASAVMAETIPPCINLIILGFVANLSIGGLFIAGLLPALLMALALIVVAVIFGTRPRPEARPVARPPHALAGAIVSLGMIGAIFGGFRAGFATATEISAFAAIYALAFGGLAFRELSVAAAFRALVDAAARSGLILFIVAGAQSLGFVLTLQHVPHGLAASLTRLSQGHGAELFLLLSIAILIVMGSVLEGAAALIIFAPLLLPIAAGLGIAPLHFGIVLVIAMGIGLFAPPLGLGLYGACLVGGVPIEATVRPMLFYLGVLLACLLAIALVPAITMVLPGLLGYG